METDRLGYGLAWGVAFGLAIAWVVYRASYGGVVIWCDAEDNGRCFREWVSALGGWAAVAAAVPTIVFLSKQVRDADRHQRTNFAIQLRRQRILAQRTRDLAYTGVQIIEMIEAPGRQPKQISEAHAGTIANIVKVLRDDTLAAFESEIEFPSSMGARATADFVERALRDPDTDALASTDVIRSFFENAAKQAEDFLREVKVTTGRS
ncbi:hypothetical protein [Neorhizobium sp. JUb45]|uniref:hypothetical protein n=1 Tax=Neorhizobium sp. JUb45 TaxID=2485113 RepID=UPI0010529867|nr:hypothetical protein [Neorhizobium sp. JUb45]